MTNTSQTPAIHLLTRTLGSWEVTLRRHPLNRAQAVRQYDAAGASWHSALARLGVPGAYGALWHDILASEMPAPGPLRVLDCGIGTGAFSEAFAANAGTPVRIDGIDLSPVMLREADARLGATVGADLQLGDVRSLQAPGGAYDITGAAHLLEHLGDPAEGLAEMMRVTRPGGLVVACLTRAGLPGSLISMRWRTHLFTPATALLLFEAAGLRDVRVRPLGAGWPGRLSLAVTGRTPMES
ncbi:MAG: class I SAM-dependent methyltransferase [Pseudomonadota bacterium]